MANIPMNNDLTKIVQIFIAGSDPVEPQIEDERIY